MNITQSEQLLFDEWLNLRPSLVRDGLIDADSYLASSPRILLILKEVNDPNGGGWDLRSFVRGGGRPQTWDNVTRWLKGIRNCENEIPWKDLQHISETDRQNELRSIAVMNMKKTPGSHTTDVKELYKIAAQDSHFLRQQLNLYEPDIILCCGTAHLVETTLLDIPKPNWQMTRRGVIFIELQPHKFLISFSHPAARCPDSFLYYSLLDAVKEILGK